MIKKLIGLLSESRATAAPAAIAIPRAKVEMHWRAEAELPIPDWLLVGEAEPGGLEEEATHEYWTSAASTWLEQIRKRGQVHF